MGVTPTVRQFPARIQRSDSGSRRATASIKASVRSATVSVSEPAVFVTTIPRSVAAATSTLS